MDQETFDVIISNLTEKRGDGCECMLRPACPDPWFHQATAVCDGCDSYWEFREMHTEDCAERCIARLLMTAKSQKSSPTRNMGVYALSTIGAERNAKYIASKKSFTAVWNRVSEEEDDEERDRDFRRAGEEWRREHHGD